MDHLKRIFLREIPEFGLIFLLVGGVWVSLSLLLKDYQAPEIKKIAKETTPEGSGQLDLGTSERISRHLKTAQLQKEIKDATVWTLNEDSLGRFKPSTLTPLSFDHRNNNWGLDLYQEDAAGRVSRQISGKSESLPLKYRPEERVEAQMIQQEAITEYDESYEKEFVQTYKRNAAKAGYRVEFNKDLEVVYFAEIPNQEPVLFDK